jgi:uncharacterized cysteine cluster protein YcgN (CxxCxxCC family)
VNNFWENKTLEQMSPDEWELLCDSCGLCCLVKIEDEDSGEVFNTSVSCFLLDIESCRCADYANRLSKAPMCTRLTISNLPQMDWLPESCAYKRLSAGRALPDWHPLLTKDKNSVHEAGISVKWFALSEEYVHPEQLADRIIELPTEVYLEK